MNCCLYKYISVLGSGWPRFDFHSHLHLELFSPFPGLFFAPYAKAINKVILKPQRAARSVRIWWLSLGWMGTGLMKNRYGNLQSHRHERIRIMTFLMADIFVRNVGLVRICNGPQASAVRTLPPSMWIMGVLGKGNFEILTSRVMTCSLMAGPLPGEASHLPGSGKWRSQGRNPTD